MMQRLRRFVRIAASVAGVGALTAALAAQTGGESAFVPVKPGDLAQEHLPATPLVFAAYAAVWLILVGYVFTLWRRVAKAEREISEIEAQLEAKH